MCGEGPGFPQQRLQKERTRNRLGSQWGGSNLIDKEAQQKGFERAGDTIPTSNNEAREQGCGVERKQQSTVITKAQK